MWELVVKARARLTNAHVGEISDAVDDGGFTWLDIKRTHLAALAGLPMHHRDPFDHLLIAQAISEQAVFVSEHRYTPSYPVDFMTCSNAGP